MFSAFHQNLGQNRDITQGQILVSISELSFFNAISSDFQILSDLTDVNFTQEIFRNFNYDADK